LFAQSKFGVKEKGVHPRKSNGKRKGAKSLWRAGGDTTTGRRNSLGPNDGFEERGEGRFGADGQGAEG